MGKEQKKIFAQYLRQLRLSRGFSTREVEDQIAKLYPENSKFQLSQSYLSNLEQGRLDPPSPIKLKALAKVYGEDYQVMLWKAGYLDQNPLKGLETWDSQAIRDAYFDSISRSLKIRYGTEEEKNSVEAIVEKILMALAQK